MWLLTLLYLISKNIFNIELTAWYGQSIDHNQYHDLGKARKSDWNLWTKDAPDCIQRSSSICEMKLQHRMGFLQQKSFSNHFLLQVENDQVDELQSCEFYNENEMVQNSNLYSAAFFQLIFREWHCPIVSYA